MFENLDDFIDLDRTFIDLTNPDEDGDNANMVRLLAPEASTRWVDLLAEPRVIVLAEAGSGKTEEIRHICRHQRLNGKTSLLPAH